MDYKETMEKIKKLQEENTIESNQKIIELVNQYLSSLEELGFVSQIKSAKKKISTADLGGIAKDVEKVNKSKAIIKQFKTIREQANVAILEIEYNESDESDKKNRIHLQGKLIKAYKKLESLEENQLKQYEVRHKRVELIQTQKNLMKDYRQTDENVSLPEKVALKVKEIANGIQAFLLKKDVYNILDKNINNAATTEVKTPEKTTGNPKLAQQTLVEVSYEKNSHKARNWIIGLGSAAVLIGFGLTGRKGKLGKNIQKMLGGIKGIDIDAINAKLNRAIPKLSEDLLKLDKIPFSEYSDLSKVKTAEIIELEDKLAQVHILPNNYKQILFGDKTTKKYTQYIVQNPSGENVLVGCFDEKGDLSGISNMDNSLVVCYGKEKLVKVVAWIKKQLSKDNYIMYHSNGEINCYSITEGNIRKSGFYPEILLCMVFCLF